MEPGHVGCAHHIAQINRRVHVVGLVGNYGEPLEVGVIENAPPPDALDIVKRVSQLDDVGNLVQHGVVLGSRLEKLDQMITVLVRRGVFPHDIDRQRNYHNIGFV